MFHPQHTAAANPDKCLWFSVGVNWLLGPTPWQGHPPQQGSLAAERVLLPQEHHGCYCGTTPVRLHSPLGRGGSCRLFPSGLCLSLWTTALSAGTEKGHYKNPCIRHGSKHIYLSLCNKTIALSIIISNILLDFIIIIHKSWSLHIVCNFGHVCL